ncbi:hypothetical protein DFH09DRAFT_1084480 [Mycena vulgaris]|nr:hypothetical protein DFH09DRAFT_1084480 [Mycena vulgaris]
MSDTDAAAAEGAEEEYDIGYEVGVCSGRSVEEERGVDIGGGGNQLRVKVTTCYPGKGTRGTYLAAQAEFSDAGGPDYYAFEEGHPRWVAQRRERGRVPRHIKLGEAGVVRVTSAPPPSRIWARDDRRPRTRALSHPGVDEPPVDSQPHTMCSASGPRRVKKASMLGDKVTPSAMNVWASALMFEFHLTGPKMNSWVGSLGRRAGALGASERRRGTGGRIGGDRGVGRGRGSAMASVGCVTTAAKTAPSTGTMNGMATGGVAKIIGGNDGGRLGSVPAPEHEGSEDDLQPAVELTQCRRAHLHVALEGAEARGGLGGAGDGVGLGGHLLELGYRRADIIVAVDERREEAVVLVAGAISTRAPICDLQSATAFCTSLRRGGKDQEGNDANNVHVHRSQEFVNWKVTSKPSQPDQFLVTFPRNALLSAFTVLRNSESRLLALATPLEGREIVSKESILPEAPPGQSECQPVTFSQRLTGVIGSHRALGGLLHLVRGIDEIHPNLQLLFAGMIYCHSNAEEAVLLLVILIDYGNTTRLEVDVLVLYRLPSWFFAQCDPPRSRADTIESYEIIDQVSLSVKNPLFLQGEQKELRKLLPRFGLRFGDRSVNPAGDPTQPFRTYMSFSLPALEAVGEAADMQ